MTSAAIIRSTLETQAMREFEAALEQAITETALDIGSGHLMRDGADATAQLYCKQVGIIEGLRLAQNMCKQVEDHLIRGKKV